MEETKVFELENNQRYYPTHQTELDGVQYFLLVNIKDNHDICIRKQIEETDGTYLAQLADEDEFNRVILQFRQVIEK